MRCLKWFIFSIFGLLLFIAFIWVGLQTRWAKDRLAGLIASATSGIESYQVTLEGLDGFLPFSIRLAHMSISDEKGAWLEARRVDICIQPGPLFTGVLDMNWLRTEKLTLSRLPRSSADSDRKPGQETSPTLSLPSVRVRDIAIDEIHLGKEITGAPLTYSLQSSARTTPQQIEVRALLQDLHRSSDALRLTAAYNLGTREIETELSYHESNGGLAAGLLGLSDSEEINLKIRADGALPDIEGHVDIDTGAYGSADLDVKAGLSEPVALALHGQIRLAPGLLPVEVASSMGGLDVDIHCEAAISSEQKIEATAFAARSPASAVSLNGTADLARKVMDVQAVISPVDVSPFLAGTGIEYQGLGPIQLTAAGPFSGPEVRVSAFLERFEIEQTAMKDVALEARAVFEAGFRGLKAGHASVAAAQAAIPQIPGLKGPFRITTAAASPDFSVWDMESLEIVGPEQEMRVKSGRIDTRKGSLSADIALTLNHLAALIPADTGGIDSPLTLRARAEGNYLTPRFTAELSMALNRLSGLPPLAAKAVGPDVSIQARAGMQNNVLSLENARIIGGSADLQVDGRIELGRETFDAAYRLLLKDVSRTAEAMNIRASGDLKSQGRITGNFKTFAAHAQVSSDSLQVNHLDLRSCHLQLETDGLPDRPSGSLRASATALDPPIDLSAGFEWSGETLSLSGVRAALPGMNLDADLELTPSSKEVSGTARGEIDSMALLNAFSDLKAGGSGTFQLKIGRSARPKDATLEATFKDLRLRDYRASKLTIRGQADDLKTLSGRVTLEASDGDVNDTRLQRLTLAARGDLNKAVLNLKAAGSTRSTRNGRAMDIPVSLSGEVDMRHDDAWRFRLDHWKALYGKLDVALARPATIVLKDGQLALDELQIQTAKGNLQAKANLGSDTVAVSARLTQVPLDLFEPFVGRDLSGTVSAGCDISGAPSDPEVNLHVNVKDHMIPRAQGRAPLRLDASLDARRQGDRFLVDMALSGLSRVPFSAKGSIPAHLSLRPFAFNLNRDEKLEGKLEGRFDLTILKGLSGMEHQAIEGLMEVDMGVEGSLDKWRLDGGVTISRGRYENAALGLILTDINGRLDADGRTLRLTRMTAVDGADGAIQLEGGIATEAPFPMDADLIFKQATLLRKEALTSETSGRLDLKGDVKRLDLTGEISLDRTELTIPKRLPPDVVVIPVTEIHLPPHMSANAAQPPTGPRFLFMDLVLNIPARFFVRGRGLDVEFKGALTIQGRGDKPVIRGTLNVVRGTFQFLTRTFHVTSGQISFDGSSPPVPYLNITTLVFAGQIDAQVRVTGPADAFSLTLTSQPPLPQDEIMAYILFGRSVARLNAFQAYQLAASLSQIAGGGIPDIAGETRKLLGIDRLTIDSGDGGDGSDSGPTLSAGKYVTDKVYVGLEQDLTDAKQDVVVEVDITPNFSVESKAGTRSGAGLGFNWKYDY